MRSHVVLCLGIAVLVLLAFASQVRAGQNSNHGHDHDHGQGHGHNDHHHDDDNEEDEVVTDGSQVVLGPSRIGGLLYPACRMTPPRRPSNRTYEYCPTAVVNGISVACRDYWMRKAFEVQLNGSKGGINEKCPTSSFGAIIVNHTDTSPTNYHDEAGNNCGASLAQSSGRRGSVDDPTNHAEKNATSALADKIRGHGRDRSFWGKLSQYTTGESCSGCTSSQMLAGFKEIIYGVRIGEFIRLGEYQTKITSLAMANLAANVDPPNPLVIIGQVGVDYLHPHFAWKSPNGAGYPCPHPCVAVPNAIGSGRCRMPSL